MRSCAKIVMAVLALAGITGIYLRQHRQAGVLGLVGYAVFAVGYLTILAVEVIAATVLPALLDTDPGYVQDVLVAATGGTPSGDIGGLQVVLNVSGAGYILGGLIFGIALFRTGILARWASVLLAVSTTATAALAVLPDAFNRPFAVPEGIALIGLGVSLWRNSGDSAATEPAGAVLEPAAVMSSARGRLADPRRPPRALRRAAHRGNAAAGAAGRRARGDAGRRPVGRLPGGAGAAHRRGGGLRARRRVPVRAADPSYASRLAPAGGPGAGGGRPARRRLRPVADALLRPAARHRPAALRPAPRRRDGHDRLPRRRGRRRSAPRLRCPPGLDDPCLRDRGGGRHAGLHARASARRWSGHGEVRGDLLKAAGWVINLAVAEWAIRRPARRRTSRPLVVEGASA